jgi:hypothetical protein
MFSILSHKVGGECNHNLPVRARTPCLSRARFVACPTPRRQVRTVF